MKSLKFLILACIFCPSVHADRLLVKIRKAPTVGAPTYWFAAQYREDMIDQVVWIYKSLISADGHYLYRQYSEDGKELTPLYLPKDGLEFLNPSPTACNRKKLCKGSIFEADQKFADAKGVTFDQWRRDFTIEEVYADRKRQEYIIDPSGRIIPAHLVTLIPPENLVTLPSGRIAFCATGEDAAKLKTKLAETQSPTDLPDRDTSCSQ